jgi:hypothetical protein
MPSETDVANVALRLVGGTRITSFTQATPNANAINDIYSEIRDNLLEFPWNFATQRVELARLTTTPSFKFDYGYALPSDWIYTISVHDNDGGFGTIDFREEQLAGQKVLTTDSSAVYLTYVKRETNPNLMPPSFRIALSSALARNLAITIANSNVLEDQLAARAEKDLAKAKSIDAMGSFPEPRPRGSWALSRNGFR